MASLDDFMPDILPDVEGCPEVTAKYALVQAAIYFCRTTQAWTEMLDPIPVREGEHTYELDMPSGAELVMVREVWLPGGALQGASLTEIARTHADWQTAVGAPAFYNMLTWGELRIYPIPKNQPADLTMTVRAALKPSPRVTSLPDVLAVRWRDALIERTKMSLLLMAGKTWANPEQALLHQANYKREADLAGADRLNDGVGSGGTVYAVRFGG